MKTRSTAALIAACLGLMPSAAPRPAQAQPRPDQDLGSVYLSFEPDRHDGSRSVRTRQLFTFYLVLDLDLQPGVQLDMRCCEGSLVFAPSLYINAIQWPASSLLMGDGLTPGNYDFISCWYPGMMVGDGPNVIASFTALMLEESPQILVSIERAAWCHQDCVPFNWLVEYKTPTGDSYNVIHKAAVDREDSPLAVVARAVADGESSWGRVKALYDQSNVPRSNTLATVK